MRASWMLPIALVFATTGHAEPPDDPTARGLRAGANHHLGDDGFVAAHGRQPGPDDEHARVHDHFTYVRGLLASHPPTKPELAARRAELLHYFDDYIAKDITPLNVHVPWRTPVFIDDHGTICAVGYLIEQSTGRALPEKIAASHRYDYIEDIAKVMPEVHDWVASSGFTLDELASIQPGYEIADIEMWSTWNFDKRPVEDGEYTSNEGVRGHFLHGRMDGEWKVVADNDVLRGRGVFAKGAAGWRSFYPDGKLLAEGPFVENVPHGTWTFYHPSGNVAGTGKFRNGYPNGEWSFYYDSPARAPIAKGALVRGTAAGTWSHFDEHGVVFAKSADATPSTWRKGGRSGYLLSIVTGADRIAHQVHEGRAGNDENHRLDMFSFDGERIFVTDKQSHVFDAGGHELVHDDDGWTSHACEWTKSEKAAARRGDLSRLHGLLDASYDSKPPECAEKGKPVAAARADKLARMMAPVEQVHAQNPQFIRDLALGDENIKDVPADLVDVLARNMSWFIEWPHVHGKIVAVYATLPGFSTEHAYADTMEQMGMK